MRAGLGQIGRRRIEAFADIALRHAGTAMADGAMGGEMLDADHELVGLIEIRRNRDAGRMRLDRAGPHRIENLLREAPMRIGCGDIIAAEINESRRCRAGQAAAQARWREARASEP